MPIWLVLLWLNRRLMRRIGLGALLFACVLTGAALRLWGVGDGAMLVAEAPVPPSEAVIQPPAGPLVPDAPPGVRSFAPPDQYPLQAWTLDEAAAGAGHVLMTAIKGGPAEGGPAKGGPARPLTSDQPLDLGETLVLSGWAGDSLLGMRFTHVLFSLCGKVIGATPVDRPRPERAQYLNPTLADTGWEAELMVIHLPRCPEPVLQVWAARHAGFLYPLAERYPLVLPAAPRPLTPLPGASPLRPGDLPPVVSRLVRFNVRATLRTCPRVDCAAMGVLPRGVRRAAVLEHVAPQKPTQGGPTQGGRPGKLRTWSLLVVGDQAGWVADETFTVMETGR